MSEWLIVSQRIVQPIHLEPSSQSLCENVFKRFSQLNPGRHLCREWAVSLLFECLCIDQFALRLKRFLGLELSQYQCIVVRHEQAQPADWTGGTNRSQIRMEHCVPLRIQLWGKHQWTSNGHLKWSLPNRPVSVCLGWREEECTVCGKIKASNFVQCW